MRKTLLERAIRKVERVFTRLKGKLGKALTRAVFTLPVISRHDPRKNVIRFKSYCQEVERFPETGGITPPHWYLKVRPAETVCRKNSVALNQKQADQFHRGTLKYQAGNRFEIPEVFVASVNRARLYSSDFLVLSSNNQVFFESALSRQDYLEENGFLDRVFKPPLKRLAGEHSILANRSTKAYYHWLIEVLPKLSVLEQVPELSNTPLILPRQLQQFHRDSLKLAGIDQSRIVAIEPGFWQVDRLYFPELPAPTGHPSPHAIQWLRTRFLNNENMQASSARRIYLTRRDAIQRRLLNEEIIIGHLKTLGFEIICPGEHSFAEQIEIFRNVQVVVAPHGAGLTNMVFAPVGATVVEFFGDNYVNGCFWAMANICGHKHAFLIGPSKWLDYSISLDELKALLEKIGI